MNKNFLVFLGILSLSISGCGGGGGGSKGNSSSISSNLSSSQSSSSSSSLSSIAPSSISSSSSSSSSSSLSSQSSSLLTASSSSLINSSSTSSSSSASSTPLTNPVRVSGPEGAGVAPRVVIDDQGNALVIWQGYLDSSSSSDNLIVNRYVKGQGWGTPELLESDGASIDKANIFMDQASGNAVVMWTQLTSASGYDLWVRRFNPATGWAQPERIENSDKTLDMGTAVIDNQGTVTAVWSQIQPTTFTFSMWSSRYTSADGWSTPVLIEDNEGLGIQDLSPQVASLGNGKVIAVWMNTSGNRQDIVGNLYTPNSGWATDEVIVEDTGGLLVLNYPRVVNDGTDKALLAWGQFEFTNDTTSYTSRIMVKSYNNGWSTESLAIGDDPGSDLVSTPFIDTNSNGSAVATWARKNQSVMVITRGNNGSWSQQTPVKPANADFLRSAPEAVIDDNSNGLLVWSQESNDNSSKDSWFSVFSIPNGGWSQGALLEPYSGTAEETKVASNKHGDKITVWSNFNVNGESSRTEIFTRYFPSGTTATPVN